MHNTYVATYPHPKNTKNAQHCAKNNNIDKKKFIFLVSYFLSICVYLYVPTNVHLCVYISLYINAFFVR